MVYFIHYSIHYISDQGAPNPCANRDIGNTHPTLSFYQTRPEIKYFKIHQAVNIFDFLQ